MDYDKKYNDSMMDRFDAVIRCSEAKKTRPYTLVPVQASTDSRVLSITEDSVLDFLDVALEQTYLLLDDDSFYICDLSKETSRHYNTLVFQINGSVLKSKETTTHVITRYMKYIGVDYQATMQLGKSLGILSQCPFVCCSLCFTPLNGASRKPVSWIGLHHVQAITPHLKATYFNIDAKHELILNIPHKKASRLIRQTKILSDSLKKMATEWLTLMHHQEAFSSRPNVVTRCTVSSHFSQPLPLLSTWLMTQSFLQGRWMVKDMLKEGDPLLDYLPPEELSNDNEINDED
ncbi:ComK protein [Alkalibacterium subtropicum]|uniref:ComK protein n=1 Tax=Alkalibacterium subtropicum TaxID=753702 RepID=A0A1I1GG10_9LACT|nr:competence protein ComK [Alkalibacterium subtropicum]SFC10491.1 ComK protein [Alkalibacterium subtropicum]